MTVAELVALRVKLTGVLEAARVSTDHVSTLIEATNGRVSSGPGAGPDDTSKLRSMLGRVQRQAPPFPLGDQLRRANESLEELAELLAALELPPPGSFVIPILPPYDRERIQNWTVPALTSAGSSASVPLLEAARADLAELSAMVSAMDGRLRLVIAKLSADSAHQPR